MKRKINLLLAAILVATSLNPSKSVLAKVESENTILRAPVREYIPYIESFYQSNSIAVKGTIYRRVYRSGHYYQGSLKLKSLKNTGNKYFLTYSGILFLAD